MESQTISALLLVLSGTGAQAQSHPGVPYGVRDPTVCELRKNPVKGAPAVDQAKPYFYCDNESLIPGPRGASGHIQEAMDRDRANSLSLGRIYKTSPEQNFALRLLGLFSEEHVVDQSLDSADRERIARVVEENREWLA